MGKFKVYTKTTTIVATDVEADSEKEALSLSELNSSFYDWKASHEPKVERFIKEIGSKRFENLIEGDEFCDSELFTEVISGDGTPFELDFNIVGDHLYSISNGNGVIVIAQDNGNGHGRVLNKIVCEGY